MGLTEEQKRESRRSILRGAPVADPELAAIIVRTRREARGSTVPVGVALGVVGAACSAYLHLHQGVTAGFFVATMWVCLFLVGFWVLVCA